MKNRGAGLVALFAVLTTFLAVTSRGEEKGTRVELVSPASGSTAGPEPAYRVRVDDYGVVLKHGGGPRSCDALGARDVWVWEHDGTYYMHYDGSGPKGWLTCLATSKDLLVWKKKGAVLDLGKPGDRDSATASYGTVFHDGGKWHMFYLASSRASEAPDRVPIGPYYMMKAEADSPVGPWRKDRSFRSFEPVGGVHANAGPGQIIKQGNEFWLFYTGLGLARSEDIRGPYTIDPSVKMPQEAVENTSFYYEPTNGTWFLFTNHIGPGFTDAIWVYWTKDLLKWDTNHKAVVLDGATCSWSKTIIGLPSVLKVGDRLAVFYDGNSDPKDQWHMKRDIGLAWIRLPLRLQDE